MAHESALETNTGVRFDAGEVTGAIGDSITVLPIVVALAVTTRVSLAHALVFFGVFQVVWGVRYGLPISVEPMKALAGLAIAGSLTYHEYLGAGLIAGVVLLAFATTGTLSRVESWIGTPVIRGIQLAVALILLQTGVDLALGSPAIAAAGLAVAGVVIVAGYRRASALVVLAVGVGVALATAGFPALALPALGVFPGGWPTFTLGSVEGALAQLAMTVGNAAVATALLFDDLLDAEVSTDDLAGSMGGMCLVSIPLGGIPMCHGSGGLAGKYAFGARTGGANLVLGGLYLLAALVAGGGLLAAFPMAFLGVLLVLVAVQLGDAARESDHLPLTGAVGASGRQANRGGAVVGGAIAYWALQRGFLDRRSPS
jgi:hypothetical protein